MEDKAKNEVEKGTGAPAENGWLERHFHWRRFINEDLRLRPAVVPQSFWDYLDYTGTVALVLIVLQVISGLLLLLYYVPEPEQAFGSVRMIRNDVPLGLFYHNLHTVGAKLLVLVAFVHMFRVMIISAHRGPREPQWYSGMALILLLLVMAFSGNLLPWSEQSYWSCVIGTEALRSVPLVGGPLVRTVRGGEMVSGATLHRFFALHVGLLPVVLVVLTYAHLKLFWKAAKIWPPAAYASVINEECIGCGKCEHECQFGALKMDRVEGETVAVTDLALCNACRACLKVCPADCISISSRGHDIPVGPFFPDGIISRAKTVVATLIALFFGVFFLHGLIIRDRVPADPLSTPEIIKPDWYFMAPYQLLRELPSEGLGLFAIAAITLVVFFLPAIDKRGPRDYRERPVYLFIVGLGIAAFIVLTLMGYFP